MASVKKRPLYSVMNGIMYPAMFSPKCFREALEYKAQPEDTFIITYPKCGTTWMQSIALHIFRKGKELENTEDFLAVSPFIDMLGKEAIENMPRPGAFKSHLPFTHMPYSPESKYIFVARNPRDCCVSFYHHTKKAVGFGFWDAEFDDFFELFMAGEVEYNDYFDHLLSWYPHRNDKNAFYTTFENMKKDTRDVVLKLAKFLGQEYIFTIQRDNRVLNSILHFCSFDYMKEHLSKIYDQKNWKLFGLQHTCTFKDSLNPPKNLPEREHIRKGIVGDWKNYFSTEQINRLNQKCLERLKNTDVLEWYPLDN